MSAGGTPGYRIQGASQPNNSKRGLGRSMWSTTMRPTGAMEDVHPPSQLPTSPGPRQAATAATSNQQPVNVILPAATCTFSIAFPDPDSETIYRLTLYLTDLVTSLMECFSDPQVLRFKQVQQKLRVVTMRGDDGLDVCRCCCCW